MDGNCCSKTGLHLSRKFVLIFSDGTLTKCVSAFKVNSECNLVPRASPLLVPVSEKLAWR